MTRAAGTVRGVVSVSSLLSGVLCVREDVNSFTVFIFHVQRSHTGRMIFFTFTRWRHSSRRDNTWPRSQDSGMGMKPELMPKLMKWFV